ncbi:hypothetical protein [Streptomyces sp. NBC_01233]|uniref:hypothetical protein n=1 Tax=Streptomyces sp. NBC_01233 TaxID=2903787 RepID=UPI002E109A75
MTQDAQKTPRTTNNAGIPVESDEHSLTLSPDGPILLQDHYWGQVDRGIGDRISAAVSGP